MFMLLQGVYSLSSEILRNYSNLRYFIYYLMVFLQKYIIFTDFSFRSIT